VTIVTGLDQHRAQITAESLETSTGEIGRARVAPAHRAGVRRFVERFRGQELEVALEATTGWRFVVEELRRVGATVHLATWCAARHYRWWCGGCRASQLASRSVQRGRSDRYGGGRRACRAYGGVAGVARDWG
jgi:hypothetical protein